MNMVPVEAKNLRKLLLFIMSFVFLFSSYFSFPYLFSLFIFYLPLLFVPFLFSIFFSFIQNTLCISYHEALHTLPYLHYTSWHQQIFIFIKVNFAVGIIRTFSSIKARSYSWVHQFSVRIWNSHKHFCKSTIYQLEAVTAHRGTVVQLDQVWCSPLLLVAFVHLDAFISTLQSIGPKLVKIDSRV
jgi:hypothetical protein